MGVARVLALHKDAVAAEDRRGAIALGYLLLAEVDLGIDTQAADDSGDRIPIHLDQAVGCLRRHLSILHTGAKSGCRSTLGSLMPLPLRTVAGLQFLTAGTPSRFNVKRVHGVRSKR